MTVSTQVLEFDGIAVELATVASEASSIRRTVARYQFRAGSDREDFWGFSFGSGSVPRRRAAYEVLERLFTYRPFRRACLKPVLPECFTLLGRRRTRRIPDRYLFIREGVDHSAGSGSSAHTSLSAAIAHGVREVVERDLLCRWWYQGAFGLQQVGSSTRLSPDVTMSSWTVAGGQVPFCVSTIFDRDEQVFVTGSKVSSTLNEAKVGAQREALLLYETLPPEGAKVAWRVGSLRGPLAQPRIRHFRQTLVPGRVSRGQGDRPYTVEQLQAACGRTFRGGKYAVMADLPQVKVVKVHCPGWLTKAGARMAFEHSGIPPDPFC